MHQAPVVGPQPLEHQLRRPADGSVAHRGERGQHRGLDPGLQRRGTALAAASARLPGQVLGPDQDVDEAGGGVHPPPHPVVGPKAPGEEGREVGQAVARELVPGVDPAGDLLQLGELAEHAGWEGRAGRQGVTPPLRRCARTPTPSGHPQLAPGGGRHRPSPGRAGGGGRRPCPVRLPATPRGA